MDAKENNAETQRRGGAEGVFRRGGPRRDYCWAVGKRARLLTPTQAAEAWAIVARKLEDDLSMMDLPKFWDLLVTIRAATILAKKPR
jgi:hypothetical protein